MSTIPNDQPHSAESYARSLRENYPHDPQEDFFAFELCLPLLSPMGRPDGREEVTVFSSTNYEDCVTVVSDLLKKMAEANCLSGIGLKIYFYQGDRARDALEMTKACSEEAE